MKENSSNKDMNTTMEALSHIKRVESPEGLYDKILLTIQKKQEEIIPLYRVRSAAAILLFALSIEFYAASKTEKRTSETSIGTLVYLPSNMIYND